MKQWEDSIKDRLEGYESPLPEGSLAEFRALRDGKAARPAKKIAPWIWGLSAAVAAGLAAILFLRQPETTVDGIHVIEHSTTPVAAIMDASDDVVEPQPSPQLIAQAVAPKAVPSVSVRVRDVIAAQNDAPDEAVDAAVAEKGNETTETTGDVEPDIEKDVTAVEPSIRSTSPYIPQDKASRSVQLKVAPAVGIVAGSGLLAAVVAPLLGTGVYGVHTPSGLYAMESYADIQRDGMYSGIGEGAPETGFASEPGFIVVSKHSFPIKLGLSTRIPVAERWYVSTGLEYSLYQSSFTDTYLSSSGEMTPWDSAKKQTAHYLGIPVRMDWVFASGRLLDVYVGGGLKGDTCLGVTLAGETIPKDGLSLSLLGAGGVQMNVIKHLGLYVEPELSWRIPSEKNILQTYRSQHPLMFSVTAGLRINMGK